MVVDRAVNPVGWLRKVLIVDDDEDFADAQAEFLEDHTYEVRVAHDADQAQELVAEFYADVAIIDLRLGKSSGIELINRLKTMRPTISCVMLTGHGCLDTAVSALRQGASDYLHKPLDPNELLLVLDRCFDNKQLRIEALEAERAKHEAEAANRAKTEFLSHMSHELRTPLNAILGFGQLLQLGDENLNDQQRRSVQQILAGGHHLLSLVNGLLELTQTDVSATNLLLEDISLNASLDVTIALLRPLAEKNEVELKSVSEEQRGVHADAVRLKQVLVNVVGNAIKYNRRNGEVRVDVTETEENYICVRVSDTGIGIKDDDKATIFEPFQRIHSEEVEIDGAGIGLAISKQLIEAMGGRIGFESEYGKGSSFWFELPKAVNDAMLMEDKVEVTDVSPNKESLDEGQQRVLYVEDNQANLILMKQVFELLPACELMTAMDAEHGIKMAKSIQPALILMDIGLPGMDGFEALKILRQEDATNRIPVMAVSAHAMVGNQEKGMDAGFCDYITKPIDVSDVLARVRTVLEDGPGAPRQPVKG